MSVLPEFIAMLFAPTALLGLSALVVIIDEFWR